MHHAQHRSTWRANAAPGANCEYTGSCRMSLAQLGSGAERRSGVRAIVVEARYAMRSRLEGFKQGVAADVSPGSPRRPSPTRASEPDRTRLPLRIRPDDAPSRPTDVSPGPGPNGLRKCSAGNEPAEERARRERATERAKVMVVRKARLGQPDFDFTPVRGEVAISLTTRLTIESFSLAGVPDARHARERVSVRFDPRTRP